MKQIGGFWFPDDDEAFHTFHLKERDRDIPFFLKQVSGRNCVIQAGGAMGLYPLCLAEHFQHVVTFEPDPGNWECLQANLKSRDCLKRIRTWHCALGERAGHGQMDRPNLFNMGANRVVPGEGYIPIIALDDIRWGGKVDAIWLDIEGAELAALKGAVETINRCSPVIVTEENGNGEKYGVDQFGIADFLETLGYSVECGIGRDRYYRRTNG